jgi:hypothetical protein
MCSYPDPRITKPGKATMTAMHAPENTPSATPQNTSTDRPFFASAASTPIALPRMKTRAIDCGGDNDEAPPPHNGVAGNGVAREQ